MFTALTSLRTARRYAPELRALGARPESIADAFNIALIDLITEVVDMDPERLAGRYAVPSAVVQEEVIDLTDDGTGTGAREWLSIDYIDWLSASGDSDEVWIATIEARHRAADEYEGSVVGLLENQQRSLRKVCGWSGVDSLVVYGVVRPVEVTNGTLSTQQYDFPALIQNALAWELAVQLAADLPDVSPRRLAVWEERRQQARMRLEMDAAEHVGSRIDEIPVGWGGSR